VIRLKLCGTCSLTPTSPPPDLVLDLFSGEGGGAVGYAKAGFEVIGIDHDPRTLERFPGESYCMDWRVGLEKFADRATLIHASPPCQRYSELTPARARERHPDLIAPVREALEATGRPWVMENVPGAPLRGDLVLCGCMFNLTTSFAGKTFALYRTRLFDASGWTVPYPGGHRTFHELPFLPMESTPRSFRRDNPEILNVPPEVKKRLIGCRWMSTRGIAEAIPPAYTEYIGKAFRKEGNKGE
jgi:DNA (cytosine-5)-methyltransferase 1